MDEKTLRALVAAGAVRKMGSQYWHRRRKDQPNALAARPAGTVRLARTGIRDDMDSSVNPDSRVFSLINQHCRQRPGPELAILRRTETASCPSCRSRIE